MANEHISDVHLDTIGIGPVDPEKWELAHKGYTPHAITVTQLIQFLGFGYKPPIPDPAILTESSYSKNAMSWGRHYEQLALRALCKAYGCKRGNEECLKCVNLVDTVYTVECRKIAEQDLKLTITATIDGYACNAMDGAPINTIVEIKCPYGGTINPEVRGYSDRADGYNFLYRDRFLKDFMIGPSTEVRLDLPDDIPKTPKLKRIFSHYLQLQLYMFFTGLKKGKLVYFFPDNRGRCGTLLVYDCIRDLLLLEEIGVPAALKMYDTMFSAVLPDTKLMAIVRGRGAFNAARFAVRKEDKSTWLSYLSRTTTYPITVFRAVVGHSVTVVPLTAVNKNNNNSEPPALVEILDSEAEPGLFDIIDKLAEEYYNKKSDTDGGTQ